MPDTASDSPDPAALPEGQAPSPLVGHHKPRDRQALLKVAKAVVRVGLLLGVGWLVWHELRGINVDLAKQRLREADPKFFFLAIGAAVLALAMMGLYDVAAFPSTPQLRPRARWGLGMLFFAWTNFLTLGPIGGPALRLFVYRKRGLETADIVRGMLRIYAGTLGGMGAWLIASMVPMHETKTALAVRVAVALASGPVVSVVLGRLARVFRKGTEGAFTDLAMARIGFLGAADWGAAVAVFALCGRAMWIEIPLPEFARAITVGQAVGYVSLIPGGLGSADAVWLKMLVAYSGDSPGAVAHIVLFRLIYYIMPWTVSLIVLYARFAGTTEALLRWQRRLLAGAVAINAGLLLASAATPALGERMRRLERMVAVDTVEASHALAVISAAVMLFLVRGLLRGYRAAFVVAGITLCASVVAHTLKGPDYEEALVSALLLVLLLGSRRGFTRRGRIPIGWELALGATLGSLAFFMLVGVATFPQLRQSPAYELYQRATAHPETARIVRGAWLIGIVGLVFMLRQAVIPRRLAVIPAPAEVDQAVELISQRAQHAAALNVACGDKGVWLWRPKDKPEGVLVYQRRHRKLIVFSDPVVPGRLASDMLEEFHAFAHDEDLDVVFYQVSGEWMKHLHEFGYTFFKLGEEAIVDLREFSLDGGEGRGFRKTIRRVEGEGVRFEVVLPPHSAPLIDEARAVSDSWLAQKGIQEMQFSLGYFSPQYLMRFPLALARDASGKLLGFLNLLETQPGTQAQPEGELTYDLIRFAPGVDGLSEYMNLKLMAWGAERGFAHLNLGMSPLFDVGEYRRSPIPERLARLAFEHGERIYNYRGLHAFKDKFRPTWEPRFMAYQRPWDWASAVLSATSLIWARSPQDRRRLEEARLGR
jgi:phosphatidylglycerol lysyltransferase